MMSKSLFLCVFALFYVFVFFFFFNDTATTEIYTLSLHDALPISKEDATFGTPEINVGAFPFMIMALIMKGKADRKSTRLNSSHPSISYAVFCLKKKNTTALVANYCAFPWCHQHPKSTHTVVILKS